MKQKIFIITGIFGHLGSTIARLLNSLKLKIRGLVLPSDKTTLLNTFEDIEIIRGDITNKNSLDDLFRHNSDEELYVIHTAGIVSIYSKYSKKMEDTNVNGTKNIIDKCIEYNVKRLLYVSSVHAINSSNQKYIYETKIFDSFLVHGAYAKTKAIATNLVLSNSNKLDVVVVHPSGIIGPYDNGTNHTTRLIKELINNKLRIGVKGGYDFVDVRDVAMGCYNALIKGKRGECYILSNKNYSIKEIFKIVEKICGYKEVKTFLPMWFAKIFAPMCELYYKLKKKSPLFTSYSLYTLNENIVFSHNKASVELDYHPRDLFITITDTISWLKTKNCLNS